MWQRYLMEMIDPRGRGRAIGSMPVDALEVRAAWPNGVQRSHAARVSRGVSLISWALVSVLTIAAGCRNRSSRVGGDSGGQGGDGSDATDDIDGSRADGADGGVSESSSPDWQWQVTCPDGHEPLNPIDYGRCAVDQALADVHATRAIIILSADDPLASRVMANLNPLLDMRPESYVVVADMGTTLVIGRDAVGAMYGALEVAEGLRLRGPDSVPPIANLRGAPTVSIRAANLFLTMQDIGEPFWWFLDESFWRQYLDLLAHSRLNILDIHAMYDQQTTQFPNALLYLATSASFPDVGVPSADRERNLKMLNRVIALARARGVGVGLMTYQASSSLDGTSPEVLSEAALQTYTREAAADLGTRARDLSLFGFRIGETGRAAIWYVDTFVAGAKQAGVKASLYTRTWLSNKNDILALASAIGPNMLLETKYNAEHLGPPYPIAGGVFSDFGPYASYSYQTYLNPPDPWGLVFQIRAAGTHRIFRQASYVRTRRAVLSLALSPAVRGFSLEPPHAYSPQRAYYYAKSTDQLSPWTFARDDLMYLMWGRLAYDPGTPEQTFRALAAREAGTDVLWQSVQAASDIVPWIVTAHSCGPDSREFAPEMEIAGDVGQWAKLADGPHSVPSCDISSLTGHSSSPLDSFAVASSAETAADLIAGQATSRVTALDVAAHVLDDSAQSAQAARALDIASPATGVLARDLVRECVALADLGQYFGHKLRGATALAVYAKTGRAAWLAAARSEIGTAYDAWRKLAVDTAYIRSFPERLRMAPLGYDPFHWSLEIPALDADAAALDAVAQSVAATPPTFSGQLPDPQVWLASTRLSGPGPAELSVIPAIASAATWSVRARFASAVPADASVRIFWKPFESEKDWVGVDAFPTSGGGYTADIVGGGAGALFAVEIRSAVGAWRYPDPMVETPYVPLAP